MSNQYVLVVDDEAHMRRVLEIMLQKAGHTVFAAGNGMEALEILRDNAVDLIITDMRMPQMDGLTLLTRLRAEGMEVPVIVITAHGTIESAVEAMKFGAIDYILRPFDIEALELSIARVLGEANLARQNNYLREQLNHGWDAFIGTGKKMQSVYELIRQVAPTKAPVLITGETGTGKELAARAIHNASPRSGNLFVPINCAAIPADILEAELFGYEKGAFTGAVKDRIGKFELANEGTVFLDELAEMPLALQAKLLRFLQDNALERLGGNRTIQLDIRVIAATNRDPQKAIAEGKLREDLYYRLNVFPIQLPPLRERLEDLPQLISHFVSKHGTRAASASDELIRHLQEYHWPGNVRELENVVERALILGGGAALRLEHFPLYGKPGPVAEAQPTASGARRDAAPTTSLGSAVEALETEMIVHALRQSNGSKPRAAALLEISERALWYKIKKYLPKEAGSEPDQA